MRLLRFLALAFISAFGITQPSPGQERKVSLILGGLILGVSLVALLVMGFLVFNRHGSR